MNIDFKLHFRGNKHHKLHELKSSLKAKVISMKCLNSYTILYNHFFIKQEKWLYVLKSIFCYKIMLHISLNYNYSFSFFFFCSSDGSSVGSGSCSSFLFNSLFFPPVFVQKVPPLDLAPFHLLELDYSQLIILL